MVGWLFVSLEKVGENSSNPFEGGPNDVPISFIARRIEIEMRLMLGEQTDLKPTEANHNILSRVRSLLAAWGAARPPLI